MGEVVLGQRVELVTLEFRVKQRAIELEILGVGGSGHRYRKSGDDGMTGRHFRDRWHS
jgi:hypothetical protein